MKIFLLLSFLVFWLGSAAFIDPDFGSHLRYGQIVISQGIPATDPFSYAMPSFPYVDHAWFSGVLMAVFYPLIGFWGLGAVATLVVFSGLATLISTLKDREKFLLPPLLLTGGILFSFVSIRPVVFSFFFFCLILWLIRNYLWEKKNKYLLVPLFVVWANLHGGFLTGLIALFLSLVARCFHQRKIFLSDFVLLLGILLATLVNPFGTGLWREVWMTLSDSNLRSRISEWVPGFYRIDPATLVFLTFSVTLAVRFRHKISGQLLIIFFFFLVSAISSSRNLLFFLPIGLLVITDGLYWLAREAEKIKFGSARFKLAYRVFVICCLGIFLFELYSQAKWIRKLSEGSFYPSEAVVFLHNQNISGQLLAPYDWGGYLIWKLPEKKVFIDGRMPSWRWQPNSNKESGDAFAQYEKIIRGEPETKEVLEKYGVTYVLWPNEDRKAEKPNPIREKLAKFLPKDWLEEPKRVDFASLGGKEIYKDGVARIFKLEK